MGRRYRGTTLRAWKRMRSDLPLLRPGLHNTPEKRNPDTV